MADNTGIEWTDATWNPTVGCSILSPGCSNCYAMKMAARIEKMNPGTHYAGTTKDRKGGAVWTGKLALAPESILTQPLRWTRGRRIFVNSMSDLFHEDIPDAWIDRVFATMALCPQHTFQILTKRSARMRRYMTNWPDGAARFHHVAFAAHKINPDLPRGMPDGWVWQLQKRWPLPNVWLGVSAEDQIRAEERIPDLIETPAAIRFVSAEPLLGPIDFAMMPFPDGDRRHRWSALTGQAILHATGVDGHPDFTVRVDKPTKGKLDWIIVGAESGRSARLMQDEWALSIAEQCKASGTAFFAKQLSADIGKVVKDIDLFPPLLQVRQYPADMQDRGDE